MKQQQEAFSRHLANARYCKATTFSMRSVGSGLSLQAVHDEINDEPMHSQSRPPIKLLASQAKGGNVIL